jgi:alanyl aminopeptidase
MVRNATTELTYDWIRNNTDKVIGLMPGGLTGNIFPTLGRAFCTVEKADEWEAYVVANGDKLPGYERDLAQATESARLCAALREASADDLVNAFREI